MDSNRRLVHFSTGYNFCNVVIVRNPAFPSNIQQYIQHFAFVFNISLNSTYCKIISLVIVSTDSDFATPKRCIKSSEM